MARHSTDSVQYVDELLRLVAKNDAKWSWYQLDRALSTRGLILATPLRAVLRDAEDEGLIRSLPGANPSQPVCEITEKGKGRIGQTETGAEVAKDLVGVSVGAEPKVNNLGARANRILSKRESFGSMRSKLVYKALEGNPANKDAFFSSVIALFGSARLSPMAPHVD